MLRRRVCAILETTNSEHNSFDCVSCCGEALGETGSDLVQKAHVKFLVLLELLILSVGAEVREEALSTRLSKRSLPS